MRTLLFLALVLSSCAPVAILDATVDDVVDVTLAADAGMIE
jgi:hypothetical protein